MKNDWNWSQEFYPLPNFYLFCIIIGLLIGGTNDNRVVMFTVILVGLLTPLLLDITITKYYNIKNKLKDNKQKKQDQLKEEERKKNFIPRASIDDFNKNKIELKQDQFLELKNKIDQILSDLVSKRVHLENGYIDMKLSSSENKLFVEFRIQIEEDLLIRGFKVETKNNRNDTTIRFSPITE